MWGYFVIMFGIIAIVFIFFMQSATRTDQHNFALLREACENAMYDSVDKELYKKNGTVKIDRDTFVENFMRRFAETASLAREYKIDIYDINEDPPKVSIKVSSAEGTSGVQNVKYTIVNKLDAIIETKKWEENKNERFK